MWWFIWFYVLLAGFAAVWWVSYQDPWCAKHDLRMAFLLGWIFWPVHGLAEGLTWLFHRVYPNASE